MALVRRALVAKCSREKCMCIYTKVEREFERTRKAISAHTHKQATWLALSLALANWLATKCLIWLPDYIFIPKPTMLGQMDAIVLDAFIRVALSRMPA